MTAFMSVGRSAFSPPLRPMTTTATSEKLVAALMTSSVYTSTVGSGSVQSCAFMDTVGRVAQ